jgi:hypothetical protein
LDNRDAVLCKNQSGELIPPRSVVKLDGTFTNGARDVIQPDADSLDSSLLLFTGEQAVPVDAEFWAVNKFEVLLTLNTDDTSLPSIGDDVGTTTDTWTLSVDQLGMKARGTSGGYVYAVPFSGGVGALYTDTEDTFDSLTVTGNDVGLSSLITLSTPLPLNGLSRLRDDVTEAAMIVISTKSAGGDKPFIFEWSYSTLFGLGDQVFIRLVFSDATETSESAMPFYRVTPTTDSAYKGAVDCEFVVSLTEEDSVKTLVGFKIGLLSGQDAGARVKVSTKTRLSEILTATAIKY